MTQKVSKILGFLQNALKDLEKVADENDRKAQELNARRHSLAEQESRHLDEATDAKNAARGIRALMQGGINA